jgi:hypothetical protein
MAERLLASQEGLGRKEIFSFSAVLKEKKKQVVLGRINRLLCFDTTQDRI